MRRAIRENSLGIALGLLFLASLVGQAIAGWQPEYLQFLVFLMLTVWLVQRGSPESKPVGAAHTDTGIES